MSWFSVVSWAGEFDASQCVAPSEPASADALEAHATCLALGFAPYDQTSAVLERVLAADPGRESAIAMAASFGRWVEPARADALLAQIRDLDLTTPAALGARAELFLSRHEWQAARRDLDEALASHGADAHLRLARAEVAWCAGDRVTAARDARAVLPVMRDLNRLRACRLVALVARADGDDAAARAVLSRPECRQPRVAAEPGVSGDALLAELEGQLDATFGRGLGRPPCP